jgi:MFS family permease
VLSHPGILFTSAAEAAQYLAYGAMETFVPLYALQIGLSPYEIGLLLGLQVTVLTLTKPVMGRISDRTGRRGQIVAGLLLGSAGLVATPFCASFWGLLPAGLAFGLSMASVTASTAALVSDLARAGHGGAAMGTMSTIMDIGHASGPIVSGLLISAHGYRAGFLVLGATLAAVGLIFPLVVRSPQPSAEGPRDGQRPPSADPPR